MRNRKGEYNIARDQGCTVTFEDDDGRRLTLTRSGHVTEALRAVVAIALHKNDRYRIRSISTPRTIAADLAVRLPGGSGRGTQAIRSVEAALCASAGLPRELLHDSFAIRGAHERR